MFVSSEVCRGLSLACEAGVSIKPGRQPQVRGGFQVRARAAGERPSDLRTAARFHGLLRMTAQFSWGSRPSLYAYACFAG